MTFAAAFAGGRGQRRIGQGKTDTDKPCRQQHADERHTAKHEAKRDHGNGCQLPGHEQHCPRHSHGQITKAACQRADHPSLHNNDDDTDPGEDPACIEAGVAQHIFQHENERDLNLSKAEIKQKTRQCKPGQPATGERSKLAEQRLAFTFLRHHRFITLPPPA